MAVTVAQLLRRVSAGLTAEIVITELLRDGARREGGEREGGGR
jgi:hypothetical protein